MNIYAEKDILRRDLRQQRCQLTVAQISALSLEICTHLHRFSLYQEARRVGLYLPIDNEVDLTPLISQGWDVQQEIFLPVVAQGSMIFVPYRPGDRLRVGAFGIREPQRPNSIQDLSCDLYLMPVVGYDRQGNRLGYGGGYFDRYFSAPSVSAQRQQAIRIGVAFAFQESSALPVADHDVPVHYIANELGILATSPLNGPPGPRGNLSLGI